MEDKLLENNDMLASMNEVYEERERIYAEREIEYKRHRKILSDLTESAKNKLKAISSEQEKLNEQEEALNKRMLFLEEKENELKNHSEQIEQTKKELENSKYTFENKKSKLFAEIRYQKEQLKNEQIKAQQLQEELQTQLTLLGLFKDEKVNPIECLQKILPQENAEDLRQLQQENVKLMSELDDFRSSCSNLTKQLQIANEMLKEKDEELKSKNEEWRKERQELISTFAKSYEKKESSKEKVQVIDDTEEGWEEHIEEDQQTHVDEKEKIYEELTADVLKKYIDKNEPQCTDLEIKHAESGEQLHFNVNDKKYVFSFEESPYFEISVHRKNSSRLKKIISHYNEMYDDVKFIFENEHVYATSFFKDTMSINELMDKVWKISQHFE